MFSEIWGKWQMQKLENFNKRECLICRKEFGSVKECSDHFKICKTLLDVKNAIRYLINRAHIMDMLAFVMVYTSRNVLVVACVLQKKEEL